MNLITAPSKPGRFALNPFKCIVALFFLLFLLPFNVHAGQVTLAWDPDTDPGLAGYKLYYGTQSGNYSLVVDVGNSTTYLASNLQAGTTYYFAATAYDTAGLESGYSNEISYNAPSTCTYSISPATQTLGSSGGSGTITVTTQGSCPWTATGGSWVTIAAGGGTGSGTVSYSVSANTGASRTAASTIAGKIFTVTQAGVQNQAYSITASDGPGGSISPAGAVSISPGASQTYTITPDPRYRIQNVVVDGKSVGAQSSYTFANVTTNHTINVNFRKTK